jgi:uncharacterized MAPEG superfamily protein
MIALLPGLPISTDSVLLSCVAIAAVLIYLPFLVVAYGRLQTGLDMEKPRALFDRLPPYAQRATWAHQNAFETFMVFAVGALMAYVTQQDAPEVAWAAIAFVMARTLYPVFYILNIPIGRSAMFAIGTVSTITLFTFSLM